jgi:hypothetical protein
MAEVKELSGVELDRAVAERVMDLPEVEMRGDSAWYRDTQREAEYGGRWSTRVREYSQSHEAAMQLIPKMAERGFLVVMEYMRDDQDALTWVVTFHDAKHNWTEIGELLPETISKAALGAIGASNNG